METPSQEQIQEARERMQEFYDSVTIVEINKRLRKRGLTIDEAKVLAEHYDLSILELCEVFKGIMPKRLADEAQKV